MGQQEKNTNDDTLLSLAEAAKDGDSLSQNIFEEIVWNFPDIIHSVDRDGVLLSTNKKATELLGYTQEELIGKSVFDLYHPSIRSKVQSGFKQLKQVGIIHGIQSQLITKSGETIEVEIRSLSVYKGNDFIKTFSIIRDLRDVVTLRNQLQQQSKLASIGELSAGIIHDIRNPLSIITSYNHFLQKAIQNDDRHMMEKIPEKIEKAAQHIARLTNHLQQFMRQEQRPIEEVFVSQIADNSLLIVENRVKSSGARVENKLDHSDLSFQSRPDKIEQVLINLISNAADALKGYEHSDKVITLDAHIENHENKEMIKIEVHDNGPGIPEDILNQIFQAFFTTKERESGTGLGLSICQGILQDEKGCLDVTSVVGQGTTFTISLPIDPKE